MTIRDLLDQFEIQGWLRIQRVDDYGCDVFYDDIHENDLVNRNYPFLDCEIKYMYPSTTYDERDVEVPQVVIEIE